MVTPSVGMAMLRQYLFKGYAQHIFRSYDPTKLRWNNLKHVTNCYKLLQIVTMLQTCLVWDWDRSRHTRDTLERSIVPSCPAATSLTQEQGPPCWASQLVAASGDYAIWDCKQLRSYGVQTCKNMYKHNHRYQTMVYHCHSSGKVCHSSGKVDRSWQKLTEADRSWQKLTEVDRTTADGWGWTCLPSVENSASSASSASSAAEVGRL